MQNNQENYFRCSNHETYTPNNYSIGQNSNNQQRFNHMNLYHDNNTNRTMNDYNNQRCLSSIQYPQNSSYYSQQSNYGYGYRPTGIMNNTYGINDGQYNNRGQTAFNSIDCCGSKGMNTVNQFNRYGHNGEINSYNCFDKNNYSPSSLTNRALNIHMNGLYTNSYPYRQQSNLFEDYQRKYC